MPIIVDFSMSLGEDVSVAQSMEPPTNISGWGLQFQVAKNFPLGPSGLLFKCVSSGFQGVSGITVTDGGQGIMNIDINGSVDMSGWETGNYAYRIQRTDSGYVKSLTEGYLLLEP